MVTIQNIHTAPRSKVKLRTAFALTASLLALGGCQSAPYPDATPEIQKLEAQRNEAIQNHVNLLSPEYFSRAESSLRVAKEKQKRGKDTSDAIKDTQTQLNKAIETAAPARVSLSQVLSARERANKAQAPELLKKEFNAIDADLLAATDDVGDGDLRRVEKYKEELFTRYENIEIAAILKRQLGEAAQQIQSAQKSNAENISPVTFKRVSQEYAQAEKAIRAQRHNEAVIAEATAKVQAESSRLIKILSESKRLGSEKVALEMEEKDLATQAALKKVEEEKAQLAAQNAAELAKKQALLAESEQQKLAVEQQNSALTEQQKKLQTEKELEEKYRAAKKQFSSREAEVFKDGNNVLIRLKGISFASGRSDLASANYPLLNKVQTVISGIGPKAVRIEGHTDAVGSHDANERLSAARAEAIKSYLIQNLGIKPDTIAAEGYGDSKPLASNKTKDGRAQNRRVDIVVTPEGVPTGQPVQ